jgi:hypothetical protein
MARLKSADDCTEPRVEERDAVRLPIQETAVSLVTPTLHLNPRLRSSGLPCTYLPMVLVAVSQEAENSAVCDDVFNVSSHRNMSAR